MKQSTSILLSVCGILFFVAMFSSFPIIDFVLPDYELLDLLILSYVSTPIATFVFGLLFSTETVTNRVLEVVKYLLVAVFSFGWLFGFFYALESSRPYYAFLLAFATFIIIMTVVIIKADKEAE